MSMTEVLPQISDPETEQEEPTEAHYVRKEDQMRGYIEGTPIQALCGKVWVPSKDYSNKPVCERCKEIRDEILKIRNGRGSN